MNSAECASGVPVKAWYKSLMLKPRASEERLLHEQGVPARSQRISLQFGCVGIRSGRTARLPGQDESPDRYI